MERFVNYHHRQRHLLEVHGHESPTHTCPICGKVYRMFNSYSAHVKFHRRIRKYTCTICDKSFYTKYLLNVHLVKHTGRF